MKKTDVYVVVDTPKKAKKLKGVLDMFGESYGGCTFELLENKDGDKVYFNMGSEWNTDTASMIHRRLQEVSIKELRNILAREYLKEGDIVFMRFGVYESILRVKSVDDEFINVDKEVFVKTSDSIYNSGKEPIKNFIRYATEEEKALLNPIEKFTDSDISIVERLHDTLLDNHGYSLESKLLTDARLLSNKIKSNIIQ